MRKVSKTHGNLRKYLKDGGYEGKVSGRWERPAVPPLRGHGKVGGNGNDQQSCDYSRQDVRGSSTGGTVLLTSTNNSGGCGAPIDLFGEPIDLWSLETERLTRQVFVRQRACPRPQHDRRHGHHVHAAEMAERRLLPQHRILYANCLYGPPNVMV